MCVYLLGQWVFAVVSVIEGDVLGPRSRNQAMGDLHFIGNLCGVYISLPMSVKPIS